MPAPLRNPRVFLGNFTDLPPSEPTDGQQLTWLSSTALLVTSMVTTTSMSGSRGHRESVEGFVAGLWMTCTVTAGVACTSKDAAPLGVDLERTKSPNLELTRATSGWEGPGDHPRVMKWCPEFHPWDPC